MNKFAIALIAVLASPAFGAAQVQIEREPLGSGAPTNAITQGSEPATLVNDDMYHAPQYMPGYPTAAIIYPRAVQVPCDRTAKGSLLCDSYHLTPEMGRGEYLFFTPVDRARPQALTPPAESTCQLVQGLQVPPPSPAACTHEKVFIEVPVKKKKE